ncbi:MAG: hypothetical protein WCK98_07565 [bacterium]
MQKISSIHASTIVDANGRVLIPSIFRKQNQWQTGEKLSITQDELGTIKIVSKRQKLQQTQERFSKLFKNLPSSDDFLKFRKSQSDLENKKFSKYD